MARAAQGEEEAAFVPLRVRSSYSFLWGTGTPRALCERAAELGYRALAQTDRDSMAGAATFVAAAQGAGVRPILGAELTTDPRLLLLARDREGTATLYRVVSERHLAEPFDLRASLSAGVEGVHVVCATPAAAEQLRDIVPRDSLWLDVPAEGRRIVAPRSLRAAAARLDIGLLATGDVSLVHPGDATEFAAHRALRAVAENDLVGRLDGSQTADGRDALQSADAALRQWRGFDDALTNNRRVAESCRAALGDGTPIFPAAPLPPGADARAYLRARCERGLRRRFPTAVPARAHARLRRELEVIARLGFTDYFLIVGDLVRVARARGIPTVGRGSGASSIVSWALGITNVNPLDYGLTFERFLHDRRADLPDLDIDFCWRGRDEVLAEALRRYGADKAAMISTHVCFHERSARRAIAQAYGLTGEAAERVPAALVRRLEGLPRHWGIHSGGIVLGDRALTHYTALTRASKGIVVTQYEMRAIEKVGLVKIDLLGNRALSTVRETVALVAASRGVKIDLDVLPQRSARAAKLLASGDTLGCFQIESPGVRHLLQQLRPHDLHGVIVALSLIRPGPAGSGMKELYVRRARGQAPETYVDERLRPLLAGSRGILLFEEDVMQVASAVTGMPLADADGVRRAIARASEAEEREALRAWFTARAVTHGTAPAAAEEIWRELQRFGAYAFCKAHACGYGVIAYWTAVLKARYPAEFAVAILNNHQGMYPKRVHVEDARRHGVRFLSPCIACSAVDFTLEERAVRVGLGQIAGLSQRAIDSICAARSERPFSELGDFLRRTRVTRPEIESLIGAGACDLFAESRPRLLGRARITFAGETSWRERAEPGLFDAERFRAPRAPLDLPLPSAATTVAGEHERLGFAVGMHPLQLVRTALDGAGVIRAATLAHHRGRRVTVAGLLSARRPVTTKRGDTMEFLTLEDETGLVECTLFPQARKRIDRARPDGALILASGRVEDEFDALTVTVQSLAIRSWTELAMRQESCSVGANKHGLPSAMKGM